MQSLLPQVSISFTLWWIGIKLTCLTPCAYLHHTSKGNVLPYGKAALSTWTASSILRRYGPLQDMPIWSGRVFRDLAFSSSPTIVVILHIALWAIPYR